MGLFNSTVLDVVVGLVFVYLLLAILCTAANEWLAALSKSRARFLQEGLRQLLDNQPMPDDEGHSAFITAFYKHPMMTGMMRDGNHPSYLAGSTFSAVLMDLLTTNQADDDEPIDMGELVAGIPDGDVKQALLALAQYSRREAKPVAEALEGWFNEAMDRVSGWYKRRTQIWTIVIAAALTIVANADTIQITRRLWVDPVLRGAMVEGAKARAQKPPATISVDYADDADPTVGTVTRTDNQGSEVSPEERQLLGQLLGWRGVVQNNTWKDWGERGFGWLLTVLALSMGAPFWFDLLNKFMNVRYAGKSPAEAAKTSGK
jgi:hypothetical protein